MGDFATGAVRIEGVTALVTGANRGLGRVMARMLVNVLSVASWFTNPAMGSYSASKAAAWAMTNGVREELRGRGVLVVGVHCGYLDTDMAAHVSGPENPPESVAAQVLDAVEAGRTEVLADERTRRAREDLGRLRPA